MSEPVAARHRAITALRSFTRERNGATLDTPATSMRDAQGLPSERCDLCGASLAAGHDHLVDPAARELRCTCSACAVLLRTDTPWRRVRHRVEHLVDFRMTDAQWAALNIPITMAFFFRTSVETREEGRADRVIALFPSPAGATEAWLPPDAWAALTADNPVLATLEADVEAILVARVGESRQTYRVSIDVGYALVGLLRVHWRGLSGGETLWTEVGRFFAGLEANGGAHA